MGGFVASAGPVLPGDSGNNVPGAYVEFNDLKAFNLAGGWIISSSGVGAGNTIQTAEVEQNHPGVRSIMTGIDVAGRASLWNGGISIQLGLVNLEWETMVKVQLLSTPIERFRFSTGLASNFLLAVLSPVDGVQFFYDDSVSPNWQVEVASLEGGTVVINSEIAVVANEWVKLGFNILSNQKASFFIQRENFTKVQVASISDKIPLTGQMGEGWKIQKQTGVTNRFVFIDYHWNRTTFPQGIR